MFRRNVPLCLVGSIMFSRNHYVWESVFERQATLHFLIYFALLDDMVPVQILPDSIECINSLFNTL